MSDNLKKLVVYYSFEGNTRFIAETIAGVIGADLLELKVKEEIKTHGFMKYFWGGRQVVMKAEPELLPLSVNPQEYDVIVIGTPVWAFTYTPAIKTFLSTIKLSAKKIAWFCCYDGGLGKTFANFREALVGNEVLGEIDFVAPLRKKEQSKAKAEEWSKEILQKP